MSADMHAWMWIYTETVFISKTVNGYLFRQVLTLLFSTFDHGCDDLQTLQTKKCHFAESWIKILIPVYRAKAKRRSTEFNSLINTRKLKWYRASRVNL